MEDGTLLDHVNFQFLRVTLNHVFWGKAVWIDTESAITEATTGLLYQPLMLMDDDECGAI
jgi:hypothetical protein